MQYVAGNSHVLRNIYPIKIGETEIDCCTELIVKMLILQTRHGRKFLFFIVDR